MLTGRKEKKPFISIRYFLILLTMALASCVGPCGKSRPTSPIEDPAQTLLREEIQKTAAELALLEKEGREEKKKAIEAKRHLLLKLKMDYYEKYVKTAEGKREARSPDSLK